MLCWTFQSTCQRKPVSLSVIYLPSSLSCQRNSARKGTAQHSTVPRSIAHGNVAGTAYRAAAQRHTVQSSQLNPNSTITDRC